MITSRRGLLGMFAAGVAASIITPGVLMPVKPVLSSICPQIGEIIFVNGAEYKVVSSATADDDVFVQMSGAIIAGGRLAHDAHFRASGRAMHVMEKQIWQDRMPLMGAAIGYPCVANLMFRGLPVISHDDANSIGI